MPTTVTTRAIQHRIQVNDVTLAVTEYAGQTAATDAPSLVLLHGIGSTGASWWPVIDQLAAHFRLLVPDLRGHGASDKPPHGYLMPDHASDLDGLLTSFGIDRPLLFGHSLGGLISLTWATEHPDKARAIAIEDSPLRGGSRVVPTFDGWIVMAQMTPDELTTHYLSEYPHWPEDDCRRRAEVMTSVALPVFQELRAANLQPEHADRIKPLSVIESPVLLVHGDLESGGMVIPDDVVRFTASLPDAQAIRIPGAGHSLHRDHPDALLNAVLPFLLDAKH
ncbi:MAG TPA: alpha/beta hydrolase [Thermomicrobiales bacterium]|nr:alpha/beta hydrolase [Thermomicrobiales bacterium]